MQENLVKIQAPIENLVWRNPSELNANDYNPNMVQPQELNLLELSLQKHGWLQPIIISDSDVIIDGFHRWMIASRNGWLIPVIVFAMDDNERMLLTIRINRAKGNHVAIRMSAIVKTLMNNGITREQIAKQIGATAFEVNLLLEDEVFNKEQITEHEYSKSWKPKKK